jgi:hypothetical protein
MWSDSPNLVELTMPPRWMEQANCAGYEDVYDELADAAWGPNLRLARELCAACPVQAECLQFALDSERAFGPYNQHRYGVYAGTTPAQRKVLSGCKPKRVLTPEERRAKRARDTARYRENKALREGAA